jgi:FlaA1/EpsC-like NDP-sugar epimerase
MIGDLRMKEQKQMLSENEGRLLLYGKVAVVFGASGAIGSQVASELANTLTGAIINSTCGQVLD